MCNCRFGTVLYGEVTKKYVAPTVVGERKLIAILYTAANRPISLVGDPNLQIFAALLFRGGYFETTFHENARSTGFLARYCSRAWMYVVATEMLLSD